MEVKKLFALASVTALTGFVATGLTAACSSTEVVTIPNEAGTSSGATSSSGGSKKDAKSGTSSSGVVPGDDDDVAPGDDDDTTSTPTCLNKDPIDATMYTYVKSIKGQKNACTAKELTDFSAYFKAHSSDDDVIDTWPTSVSEKCASCIFTDATGADAPTAWGPLVVSLDSQGAKTFDVNRGGCIEAVSTGQTGVTSGEACGRSYQQFQDCTIDACLKDCKTQADFTKCRQDGTVLTTSCKDAFAAVKSDCGEKNIGKFETACKGTTYTFEGPIKVLCISGTGAPVDAGKDAK